MKVVLEEVSDKITKQRANFYLMLKLEKSAKDSITTALQVKAKLLHNTLAKYKS